MGQVIQSFHHTSVVRLVTDGQSKVGVTFGRPAHWGSSTARGPSNSMTADLVAPHTPLHKGELMFTSSLDAASFPPGIPVATVRSFHTSAGASQETIEVDPAANLSQLAYVDVVQWVPLHVTGRSMLRVALVIFIVLMVQQTVIVALRIGGAHPDLLWLLPITAALLDGPETGAIVGFWAGLAFDLVLPTPFGLSALVGCLLGYAVGSLTTAADPRATWLKPVAALAGSIAADMLFAVLGAILGQGQMVQVDFLALFLVVGISSVVLVLPVNRLMRWALAGESNRRSLVSAQADSRIW